MNRWLVIAVVGAQGAVVGACHSGVELEGPPVSDARSALFVAFEGDTQIGIGVDRPSDGPLTLPPIVQHDDLELWALTFTCPLESVGLEVGRNEMTVTEVTVPLLTPNASFHTAFARDGMATWTAADPDVLHERVLKHVGPGTGECASTAAFTEAEEILLPVMQTDFHAFSVAPDPTRAILGAVGGSIYEVTSDGSQRRIEINVSAVFAAAHIVPGGVTYALDRTGLLYRGSFDTGFEGLVRLPSGVRIDTLAHMAGPPVDRTDAALELFVVTDTQVFLHYDGSEWTEVASSTTSRGFFIPRVEWLGPGQAATFAIGRRDEVTLYDNGRVEHKALPSDSSVFSISDHPTLGVLAGNSRGALYARDNDGWRLLFRGTGTRNFTAAIGDGLWSTTIPSFFVPRSDTRFWSPDHPECPGEQRSGFVVDLVRLENDVFLIVNQRSIRESFFVERVTLKRPFALCRDE